MGIFALAADERVANVRCAQDTLAVDLFRMVPASVACHARPERAVASFWRWLWHSLA
jgi:hypothetical protein